jgi:hypothetical protein
MLATRLGADLGIAVLHKDGFYETLFDVFTDDISSPRMPLENASLPLLLYTARVILTLSMP